MTRISGFFIRFNNSKSCVPMVTPKRQTNARTRVSRAVEWRNSSLKHHPRAPHLCVRGRPRGAQNSLIRKLPRDRLRWPCSSTSLPVHVFGGGRVLESLLFRVFGAKTCLCHYGWRKLFWANRLSNCFVFSGITDRFYYSVEKSVENCVQ